MPQETFFYKEVRICAWLASFYVCRSPKTVFVHTSKHRFLHGYLLPWLL